jgi:hypothetical protein
LSIILKYVRQRFIKYPGNTSQWDFNRFDTFPKFQRIVSMIAAQPGGEPRGKQGGRENEGKQVTEKGTSSLSEDDVL